MKQLIIILVAGSALFACSSSPEKKQKTEAEIEQELQKYMDSLETAEQAALSEWKYETEKDEMSERTNRYASKRSSNMVELDFPYEGGTYGTIMIRNSGNGDEAIFSINQGQINTTYEQGSFEVRFDDDPSEQYTISEASDGSSTIRFINKSKKFIERLKKSKECKIKVEFFNNGSFVFKFDTKNLNW